MMTASLGDGNGGSNPTMDQVQKAADEYNKIAAVAAKAGIQQGLHNEGFELAMVDGQRVYDMLFDLLDPKLVKFQFQMSTITERPRGGRLLHPVSRPVHLDARAGRRHERAAPPPPPPPQPGSGAAGRGAAAVAAAGRRRPSARAPSTGSRPSRRRRSAASRTTSSSRPWS